MATFNDKVAFTKQYAPLAIEQQIKYGIPASVTLAQMALESGWGTSRLAREANNCFGVIAGKKWRGSTLLEFDDNRWKHFRAYDSKARSIEDHSKVLMQNNYMKYCGRLSSTDYVRWAIGIKAGGYASDPQYARRIVEVIRSNGFDKIDQKALQEAERRGVKIGYMRGRSSASSSNTFSQESSQEKSIRLAFIPGGFSLPLNKDNYLVMSPVGPRNTGINGASHNHKGLDIDAKYESVFATEDNGKVITAGVHGKAGGMIAIEYNRSDNTKLIVTYMHLSKIGVKVGDTVNAHQNIGVSGASGNVSGPHLHFQVDYVGKDGQERNIDAAGYLAELSLRMNKPVHAINRKDKSDLIAQYLPQMQIVSSPTTQAVSNTIAANNVEERMKKEEQEGELENIPTGDLLADLIGPLLKAAVSLAIQLNAMSDEPQGIPVSEANLEADKELNPPSKSELSPYHIERNLDKTDASKLAELAAANYENEDSPQSIQQTQIKIS